MQILISPPLPEGSSIATVEDKVHVLRKYVGVVLFELKKHQEP